MINIKHLNFNSTDFWPSLEKRLAWETSSSEKIDETVKQILRDVQTNGDTAIVELTNRFDRMNVSDITELELPLTALQSAWERIPEEQRNALNTAAERIRRYHTHQQLQSWSYEEEDGTLLGQQITPMDRVGLYVPGGKAAYPSSVLMNSIPAKVAGVNELIMVVPTPDGELNDLVLAAAKISHIDRIFTIGGAQAIAALAYGTAHIPKVDKIVGPGNIYVATAKRQVYGIVGIDMVAGPSEILIICDGKTNPDWIAMDLFSQAEHDEDAQAILISTDDDFLKKVGASIAKLLPSMERTDIINTSLNDRGAFIKVADINEAIEIANYIAPEHLELSIENPQSVAQKIRHAGAIFMGRYTAEALGDYCAGPNHVLPTSRTARFSSPLGVYDFQKRSSLIMCNKASASELGKTASILARGENFTAHARSAEYRISEEK